MTSAQRRGPAAPVVSEEYLRNSLGITQTHPVTCHFGDYDGVRSNFHSHANATQRLGANYQVTSFTVTARRHEGGIGAVGHHVTCSWQPDGSWRITVGDGIPPQTAAALRQLAEEIIYELMLQDEELQDTVAKDTKRRKDDDDRNRRLLRNMGLKTPTTGTGKAK